LQDFVGKVDVARTLGHFAVQLAKATFLHYHP